MSETANADQLLELIRDEAGCPYLSDLHDPLWKDRISMAVQGVSAEAFSVSAWMSALHYIAGDQSERPASAEDARMALLAHLKS